MIQLSESDLSGNITDEYIFFDGRRIARRDSSGNVDYYLADQLGSARVVTNSSGSILDDCDFLPFGDEECVSSSSGNIYKFTGKERDSESGNDYFGARYYTDTLGRFLSPDPGNAGSDPSNPQSWNAYSYARNDPATVTDPTGLASCSQDSAGGWHGGAGCWDAGPSGESNREAANASAAALLGQRAQQQTDKAAVGTARVGALAKTMTNEDRSVSGGAPGELEKGKNAPANAIINNALLQRPAKVAPATGTATRQDARIMKAAIENRLNGGADPVHGRSQYGFTHNPHVQWRSAGNRLKGVAGRETMYMKFGLFDDSLNSRPIWIVIYNDPGH